MCTPESMSSEDMLFMLYTSGSTGTPKGLVHTQAGYLLYAALTHKVGTQGKRMKDASCSASGGFWVGQGETTVVARISAATGSWCRGSPVVCSQAGCHALPCSRAGVCRRKKRWGTSEPAVELGCIGACCGPAAPLLCGDGPLTGSLSFLTSWVPCTYILQLH